MSVNIELDGCTCVLACGGYPENYDGPKSANLFSLSTEKKHRRKGAAKRVMRIIRKWADRNNIPVYLNIGPFKDMPMNEDQLEKFYGKMGWRHVDNSAWVMVYTPKGRKSCQSLQ